MKLKLVKSIKKLFNPCTKEYWDKVYAAKISQGNIRQDKNLLKIIPLLEDKKNKKGSESFFRALHLLSF